MKTVNPTDADIERFRRDADNRHPIIMVNLLRYCAQAVYEDGRPTVLSGRQAYQRYTRGVLPLLWETGGRLLWMGHVRCSFIAPDDEQWDEVALVWYPSRQAFLDMVTSDAYQPVMAHRTAALDDSRLIETRAARLPKPVLALARAAVRLKTRVFPRLR